MRDHHRHGQYQNQHIRMILTHTTILLPKNKKQRTAGAEMLFVHAMIHDSISSMLLLSYSVIFSNFSRILAICFISKRNGRSCDRFFLFAGEQPPPTSLLLLCKYHLFATVTTKPYFCNGTIHHNFFGETVFCINHSVMKAHC